MADEVETNDKDLSTMSDEEFLNSAPPEGAELSESDEQEDTDNSSAEPEQPSGSDDTEQEVNSPAKLTNTDDLTNIQNKEPDTNSDNQPPEEEVNYTEFYKKVMAPFKANGKEISLRNADEAIHLMQQGANYTQKMQQLAPYRKTLLMLEKNGLLDESQLSFLIDIKNKNPEAIKKFLKDNNIDPLDIDTTQEPNYQAGRNYVSDAEADFNESVKELASSPEGMSTLRTIHDTWDTASQDLLMNEPRNALQELNNQMRSGIYQKIKSEVDRRKMLGQIPASTPFLFAYKQVGAEMVADYEKSLAQQQGSVRTIRNRTNTLSNGNKIRQAGISSNSSSPRSKPTMPNFLAMTDEEFEKQFGGRSY